MANLNNGLTADQAVVLTTALVNAVRAYLAAVTTEALSTVSKTAVQDAMDALLQVDEYP